MDSSDGAGRTHTAGAEPGAGRERTTSPWPMAAAGVTALAVTKAGDVATTAVGIRIADGLRERNPLAAAAMAELGTLPGLVVLGAATVLLIAAVVEVGVPLAGRLDDGGSFDGTSGRLACYGVGCLFNLGITVYNAFLIAGSAFVR